MQRVKTHKKQVKKKKLNFQLIRLPDIKLTVVVACERSIYKEKVVLM